MNDLISRQAAIDEITEYGSGDTVYMSVVELKRRIEQLPSAQPEHKAVFNRDIAIEAICDEVMLWFDISATQAYEIAETAVKRIEMRMEKMEKGEQK